jgi:hypothetical protein
MERRIGRSDQQSSSAGSQTPVPPIEALLVRRPWLIRLLKAALTELHEHYREIAATSIATEELQTIRYWEDILLWVKDRAGADLILVERNERRQ